MVYRTSDWADTLREIQNAYNILVVNLKGRGHLGNLGIDGRMKLKYT
jgi:hypothetical protein